MVPKLLSACVIISGLCVRHYRIAHWQDNESVDFEGFGNESSYLYLKIWSSKDLLIVFGTCMHACMHTVLCFGLCLPHIECSVKPENSAELSFCTNIETQS